MTDGDVFIALPRCGSWAMSMADCSSGVRGPFTVAPLVGEGHRVIVDMYVRGCSPAERPLMRKPLPGAS